MKLRSNVSATTNKYNNTSDEVLVRVDEYDPTAIHLYASTWYHVCATTEDAMDFIAKVTGENVDAEIVQRISDRIPCFELLGAR